MKYCINEFLKNEILHSKITLVIALVSLFYNILLGGRLVSTHLLSLSLSRDMDETYKKETKGEGLVPIQFFV